MKVVVSGVNGFVGGHLVRELVAHGHEVVGLGMKQQAPELDLADYVGGDLVEGWPEIACDAVVHLAALSAVGPSFSDPQGYINANSAPVTHLCEGLLASGSSGRVLVVSTGAVYAPGIGLTETSPTEPSSPYAVSKLLVETQCAYYRRRGLDVTVLRPFNHIGPGQRGGFLLPDLVAGVREWAATGRPLTVGNLDTRRDYTDVRDVVRAYRLALEAPTLTAPVMNVCSGESRSGRELLDEVVGHLGLGEPEVVVDPARIRPGDPPEIIGHNGVIRAELGWEPVIPLADTVRDLVADGLLDR